MGGGSSDKQTNASTITNTNSIGNTTSSAPINSYQEFSKIFNPKSVGASSKLQGTGIRKISHDNPSIEEKPFN